MNTARTVLTQGARTAQTATLVTNALPWLIGGVLVLVAIVLLTRK